MTAKALTISDIMPLVPWHDLLEKAAKLTKNDMVRLTLEEAPLDAYDPNTGTLRYQYEDFADAPMKHRMVLYLALYGFSPEQIAAQWSVRPDQIYRILRHPPIASEFARENMLCKIRAEKENVWIRTAVREAAIATREIVNDPEAENRDRIAAAKTVMTWDPDGVYSNRKPDLKLGSVMDTDSLNEVHANLERARKEAQLESVEDITDADASA